MNARRRQQIQYTIEKIRELNEGFSMLYDEEDEAFDNLPESIQTSERGEYMERCRDALYDAAEAIDSALEELEMVVFE